MNPAEVCRDQPGGPPATARLRLEPVTAMKPNGPQSDSQVLLLLTSPEETQAVQSGLSSAGLTCRPCAGAQELCQSLDSSAAALLSQEVLTAPVMSRLVQTLDSNPDRADYPFVLLFDSPGTSLREAIRLLDLLEPFGNLTVLERPIRPLALISAVRTAVRARQLQRRGRQLLHHLQEELHGRDQQLARLVHKFRTPLNTILTTTEILEQIGTNSPLAADQRALVRRQTLLLARLLGEIQEPAESIWADVSLRRQLVDWKDLVERVVNRARGCLKARQNLSFSLDANPLWVEGDPARLEEVVTALLNQAIEQAEPGGEIHLEVKGEQRLAGCRILGTSSADRNGSVRLETTALSRARQLIAMHGGSVRSSFAGNTIEINLRLPLAAAPHNGQHNGQRSAGPSRLLLVEDDEEGREALQFLLRLQGLEVVVAGDGPQGLQMALEQHPEVVLLDIDLPRMDGLEVARRIRSQSGADVRLVALTGLGRESDRRRAVEAGFDDCLVKPVTLQELSRALAVCPREKGASASG